MFYEDKFWFLYTNYKLWPVYTWENLSDTLLIKDALEFSSYNKEFEVHSIQLYWSKFEFKFPSPPTDHDPNSDLDIDISFQIYDKILSLANLAYISDYVVGLWKAIVQTYHVYETPNHQWYLKPRTTTTDSSLSSIQDQATIIMAKEALLWIYNPDQLTYKDQTFPISRDYEFPDPRNPDSILKFKSNFSAWLRSALLSKMLESWNADPKHMNFQRDTLLQKWQIDALKRMADRTVILASRRSGKSVFLALYALIQLLVYNHKKGIRPRTILYLSKDSATYKVVVDYILATVQELGWLKEFFYYNSSDAIFYFRDPTKKTVYAQIKFLTAEGKTPGVGSAADVLIVDEAMMIKPSIFERLEPIVSHEGASLLVASTFYDTIENWDRVYDWPVKLCNEYEKESSKILDIDTHILNQYDNFIHNGVAPQPTVAWLRYTIDDVDVILNKEQIKADYSVDPDRYMKELYCRSPKKNAVFNFKPHVVQTEYDTQHSQYTLQLPAWPTLIPNYWDLIVLSYDPARTGDMSALTTIWYSKKRNKISVISEFQLNFTDKSSFIPQATQIKNQLKRCYDHASSVIFCMDWSHPGVADVLIWQGIQIYRAYKRCGGSQMKKGKAVYEYNVPKKLMIEGLQFLFDNNLVEIFDTNVLTTSQLDNFTEIYNPATNTYTYEGVNDHDDFVASLMVGAYTLYEFFEFKYLKKTDQTLTPSNSSLPKQFSKSPLLTTTPAKPLTTSAFWISLDFLY